MLLIWLDSRFPASLMEVISARISGGSSLPRATSLIPMTMLMGVRSSWDTFDRKTAFCFPAVSSSAKTPSYHFRCMFLLLIQYLASAAALITTKAPSPRRNKSRDPMEREMV